MKRLRLLYDLQERQESRQVIRSMRREQLNESRREWVLKAEQREEAVKDTARIIPLEVNNMTRCTLLDTWVDAKSKELDKAEKERKKDLITGEKK